MRRLLTLVLAVFMLVSVAALAPSQPPMAQQQNQTKEQIVYVTKTGKKCHTASCRYLSKSKIPMSLKDAKAKGYTISACASPHSRSRH